jgi:hypothetical protein
METDKKELDKKLFLIDTGINIGCRQESPCSRDTFYVKLSAGILY